MMILNPALGGLLFINGKPGAKLQELLNANRGIPGKEIFVHPINLITLVAKQR